MILINPWNCLNAINYWNSLLLPKSLVLFCQFGSYRCWLLHFGFTGVWVKQTALNWKTNKILLEGQSTVDTINWQIIVRVTYNNCIFDTNLQMKWTYLIRYIAGWNYSKPKSWGWTTKEVTPLNGLLLFLLFSLLFFVPTHCVLVRHFDIVFLEKNTRAMFLGEWKAMIQKSRHFCTQKIDPKSSLYRRILH